MSEVRGMRKTRVGVVVSDKMDKTITIAVKYARSPSAVWQDHEPHHQAQGP